MRGKIKEMRCLRLKSMLFDFEISLSGRNPLWMGFCIGVPINGIYCERCRFQKIFLNISFYFCHILIRPLERFALHLVSLISKDSEHLRIWAFLQRKTPSSFFWSKGWFFFLSFGKGFPLPDSGLFLLKWGYFV